MIGGGVVSLAVADGGVGIGAVPAATLDTLVFAGGAGATTAGTAGVESTAIAFAGVLLAESAATDGSLCWAGSSIFC